MFSRAQMKRVAARYRKGGITLQQLGDEHGVNRERVRQWIALAEKEVERERRWKAALAEAGAIEAVPLEFAPLSVRSLRALKIINCCTVGDFMKAAEADLLRAPNFGRRSLAEVREFIALLRRGKN